MTQHLLTAFLPSFSITGIWFEHSLHNSPHSGWMTAIQAFRLGNQAIKVHYSDSRNEAHFETETNARPHFNLLISPKLFFFAWIRAPSEWVCVYCLSDDNYNATHLARKLKVFCSACGRYELGCEIIYRNIYISIIFFFFFAQQKILHPCSILHLRLQLKSNQELIGCFQLYVSF